MVVSAFALPKVTVPGPVSLLQAVVSAAGGFGRPSSVAVPASEAVAGNVIVCAAPAFTVGATLTGGGGGGGAAFTTIVTSALDVSAPSFAVSRST